MFNYDALAELGIDTVKIDYNGSGDEGYIEDITCTPESDALEHRTELYTELEHQAYDILSEEHSGWEINEGSHGHIEINVKERKAFLHHGHHELVTHWHDKTI